MELITSNWHHGPEHRFRPEATYFVTGGTLYKQHFFSKYCYLSFFQENLFRVTAEGNWKLRAWAVFSNHYHFMAHALTNACELARVIQRLHGSSARWVNQQDGVEGRRVWYQYWDREITNKSSYYARLVYINQNAVSHGLVPVATQYPFSSARLFERKLSSAAQRMLSGFIPSKVREHDPFEPVFCQI
jgi:putative transposase